MLYLQKMFATKEIFQQEEIKTCCSMLLYMITAARRNVCIPSAKEAAQDLLGVSHFLVSLRASKDIQNVIIKAYDKAEIKSISREKYSNASQFSLSLSKMFLMDPGSEFTRKPSLPFVTASLLVDFSTGCRARS